MKRKVKIKMKNNDTSNQAKNIVATINMQNLWFTNQELYYEILNQLNNKSIIDIVSEYVSK